MATTKTTKAVAKKAAPAKKTVPAKKTAAAGRAKGMLATVTPIKTVAKSAKAATVAPAVVKSAKTKPEKTRVLAADLRAALLAGLSHTSEDVEDKQYAAVRLAITAQGLLRVNATDKVSAIRVVPTGAVSVAGKAFHAVIPASVIEDELAKPLRGQKDKRVDIWIGPKSGKPHLFVSLDNGKQISVRLADGTYPDVDKLFDNEPPACSLNEPIKLDGERLALFADAVAEFTAVDAAVRAPIRMTFNGPNGTVRMEADLSDTEIVGLLIPIKKPAGKADSAAPDAADTVSTPDGAQPAQDTPAADASAPDNNS